MGQYSLLVLCAAQVTHCQEIPTVIASSSITDCSPPRGIRGTSVMQEEQHEEHLNGREVWHQGHI